MDHFGLGHLKISGPWGPGYTHPKTGETVAKCMDHVESILFEDTMVPIMELDYILLWGYCILHKEYSLARFNHQKNTTHVERRP